MLKSCFWTALLLFLELTPALASAANIADFVDYSLLGSSGQTLLPGRLFIPPEATNDPFSPRPLMVYLHGGGANGTDNVSQVTQTPDYMLDEAKQRGAFLYVPQTSTTWASTTNIDYVMTMIDRAIAEKNADSNRLYATGYSNGGGGTWSLLSRNHGRFAAAIAMSGVIPAPGFNPANLLGTAILALHARDDATVPVARTRTVIDGILSAAGQSVPLYPATGTDVNFLESNPYFAFHRDVAASLPPETVNFLISDNRLDLMYLETGQGGHTGLFVNFSYPPFYSWLFDHSLAVPEPTSLLFAAWALSIFALRRSRSSMNRAG